MSNIKSEITSKFLPIYFRTAVENKTKVRNLIDLPEALKPLPEVKDGKLGEIPGLKDLGLSGEDVADPRSAFPFPGGESSGIERLNNYFWKTDHVSKYKETRNGLIGEVKFCKPPITFNHHLNVD